MHVRLDSRSGHQLLLVAVVAAVLATLLLRFPPSTSALYPACPIHTFLHVQCPGCGTTRALAALLRGNMREALRWNALTTCALPLAALYAMRRLLRSSLGLPQASHARSPRLLYAAFAVTTLFTIGRNL